MSFGRRVTAVLLVALVAGACGDLERETITAPQQVTSEVESALAKAVGRKAQHWAGMSLQELTEAVADAGGRVFIGFKDSIASGGVDGRGRVLATPQAVAMAKQRLQTLGVGVQHEFRLMPVVVAEVSAAQLEALQRNPLVDYVEPVVSGSFSSQSTPWGVAQVHAPQTWATTTGGGVKVAILDSGVDTNHPDLGVSVAYRCNVSGPTATPQDVLGHGTHVAGSIAALNNTRDVVGVAYGVTLLAANVSESDAHPERPDAAELACALEWARLNGVDVVNMSLTFPNAQTAVTDQINAGYYQDDVVFVAAVGNTGGSVKFPASLSQTIGVTAVDQSHQHPSWANTGSHVDLSAPGVGILSTALAGGDLSYCGSTSASTSTCSGTSMATAHVTGAAALLRARYPGWSNGQIANRLKATAEDLGPLGVDNTFGHGFIQVDDAVAMTVVMSGVFTASPGSTETWTVSVDGGQTPLSYKWYVDGALQSTASQLSLTVPSADFSLSVEVTDGAGGQAGDSRMILVCSGGGQCGG